MRDKLKREIREIVREVIKDEIEHHEWFGEPRGIIKSAIRKEFEEWGFKYRYLGSGVYFGFLNPMREEFNKLVNHLGLEWFKKEAEEGFRKKHGKVKTKTKTKK